MVPDLMGDVWTGITNVTVHFPHHADMLVAIQKRVLLFSASPEAAVPSVRRLVSFKAGVGENDNKPLGILVGGGNWDMLLRDQLW